MSSSPPAGSRPSAGAILAAIAIIGTVIGVVATLVGPLPSTSPQPAPTAAFTAQPEAAAPTAPAAPAGPRQYAERPPMTIDPARAYTATITTPRGDIIITLRPDLAPQTVNSFVFLAREGFYDGLTWHRVLPSFMAQGGDPTGTGGGGPGYTVPAEFSDVPFDRPGILAMARANDPDSAGSQFFITTAPADYLTGQYTIFGEVREGQAIVDAIPLRDPAQNPTTPGEEIVRIRITEE